MESKLNQFVKFGKYKGKTYATLLRDKRYSSWLSAQPWIENHALLYSILNPNIEIRNYPPTPEAVWLGE